MNETTFALSEADLEQNYAMQVINLINIARLIRDGKGEALAKEIETLLPTLLDYMVDFEESRLNIAAFYAAGKFLRAANKSIPATVADRIASYSARHKEALSDECCALTTCKGGRGCVPWPTSLRPVDVNKPDPNNGWRYIVGSHCGFIWWRPWKGCGPPLGLYNCQPPD